MIQSWNLGLNAHLYWPFQKFTVYYNKKGQKVFENKLFDQLSQYDIYFMIFLFRKRIKDYKEPQFRLHPDGA